MDFLQIKNVIKTLKKTELVFQTNDCVLRVGKSDISVDTVDNDGIPDERIRIFPEIRGKEYRVLFSSPTLDKHGAANATELIDFWESNNFFFDIGSQVIADGRVEFRADLPVTLGFPPVGAIYFVEQPTLILGIYKIHTSGDYIKDTDTQSLNDWRKTNKKSRFTTSEFRVLDNVDQSKQKADDLSAVGISSIITAIWRNSSGTVAFLSDLTQILIDVALNAIHTTSDGSDHGFIDQDVTILSLPTFGQLNIVGLDNVVLTGIIFINAGVDVVTGVGTLFTIELGVGMPITIEGETFTIINISSNTLLTIDSNHIAGGIGVSATTDGKLVDIRTTDGFSLLSVNPTGTGDMGIGTDTPNETVHIFRDQDQVTRIKIENPNTNSKAQSSFELDQGGSSFTYFVKTEDAIKIFSKTTSKIITFNDASGAMSINSPIAADASAILELVSTNRGFLPPRMTTVQRDAIVSPNSGLVIYDTTRNAQSYFNGTVWVVLPDIINGTARIKYVFQQSDFGNVVSGEILLTSQTHYVPVGQIILTVPLAVPTDGIVTIAALAAVIPSLGSPEPGTTLVFADAGGIGIKAENDNLNNGTITITNLTLAAASDATKIINVKSTNKENGAVIMDAVILSGGQGFDVDNINLIAGTIVQFEPQLSNIFNITDTVPVGDGELIFDVQKWDIFKSDTPAVAGLDFFEIIGVWSTFSLGNAIVQTTRTDEAIFNIDSAATFKSFNIRGVNAILEGGVAFRSGSRNQTTLTFTGCVGIPNSVINAEITLIGNTAVTDIPAVGALVEIGLNVNWVGSQVERLNIEIDGAVELIADAGASLKIDANINIEPANASKNLSMKTVLVTPKVFQIIGMNFAIDVVEDNTGGGRVNGDTITWRDTNSVLPTSLRKDIIYYVVNTGVGGANTFQLSYTLAGAVVPISDFGSNIPHSYQAVNLFGSTPTNTITASNPRDLIPHATVPSVPGAKSFLVVINNSDAVNILVNNGYQRYFE